MVAQAHSLVDLCHHWLPRHAPPAAPDITKHHVPSACPSCLFGHMQASSADDGAGVDDTDHSNSSTAVAAGW